MVSMSCSIGLSFFSIVLGIVFPVVVTVSSSGSGVKSNSALSDLGEGVLDQLRCVFDNTSVYELVDARVTCDAVDAKGALNIVGFIIGHGCQDPENVLHSVILF